MNKLRANLSLGTNMTWGIQVIILNAWIQTSHSFIHTFIHVCNCLYELQTQYSKG